MSPLPGRSWALTVPPSAAGPHSFPRTLGTAAPPPAEGSRASGRSNVPHPHTGHGPHATCAPNVVYSTVSQEEEALLKLQDEMLANSNIKMNLAVGLWEFGSQAELE